MSNVRVLPPEKRRIKPLPAGMDDEHWHGQAEQWEVVLRRCLMPLHVVLYPIVVFMGVFSVLMAAGKFAKTFVARITFIGVFLLSWPLAIPVEFIGVIAKCFLPRRNESIFFMSQFGVSPFVMGVFSDPSLMPAWACGPRFAWVAIVVFGVLLPKRPGMRAGDAAVYWSREAWRWSVVPEDERKEETAATLLGALASHENDDARLCMRIACDEATCVPHLRARPNPSTWPAVRPQS